MIEKIRIHNYKSIIDLSLDLGRVNVIIGANGCGKSNILEAITFAAAATQNKLDYEFLRNRGIRVTDPEFMLPAFEDMEEEADTIQVEVRTTSKLMEDFIAAYYEKKENSWVNLTPHIIDIRLREILNDPEKTEAKLSKKNEQKNQFDQITKNIKDKISKEYIQLKNELSENAKLSSFLTYSPSEETLRNPNLDPAIYPLGAHGDGLLQYLKKITLSGDQKELIAEINEGLYMLDWFDALSVPNDLLSGEYKLKISDQYLKESLHQFDQRSTNEGFLYLLFYLTLFNAPQTPPFFAIDNIEASFNPKLCTKLVQHLVQVAKKKEKQVLLTTHSPYVLDGLDLSDDEQRLFVARRDIDGHTRISRIEYKKERELKLSEVWMKGYIGGLPDNF